MRTSALNTFSFAFASATSSRSVFSPATGKRQGLAYDLVGLVDGGRRQAEEDALLAADLLQLGGELLLHPPLGAGVDLVGQGDQQLDQSVGDLRLPRAA